MGSIRILEIDKNHVEIVFSDNSRSILNISNIDKSNATQIEQLYLKNK